MTHAFGMAVLDRIQQLAEVEACHVSIKSATTREKVIRFEGGIQMSIG